MVIDEQDLVVMKDVGSLLVQWYFTTLYVLVDCLSALKLHKLAQMHHDPDTIIKMLLLLC